MESSFRGENKAEGERRGVSPTCGEAGVENRLLPHSFFSYAASTRNNPLHASIIPLTE